MPHDGPAHIDHAAPPVDGSIGGTAGTNPPSQPALGRERPVAAPSQVMPQVKASAVAIRRALRAWMTAMDDGDMRTAMEVAASISERGEPLLTCPEFIAAAREYCQCENGRTALRSAGWLLMCLTELACREQLRR